jgi:hypothetical protein
MNTADLYVATCAANVFTAQAYCSLHGDMNQQLHSCKLLPGWQQPRRCMNAHVSNLVNTADLCVATCAANVSTVQAYCS